MTHQSTLPGRLVTLTAVCNPSAVAASPAGGIDDECENMTIDAGACLHSRVHPVGELMRYRHMGFGA